MVITQTFGYSERNVKGADRISGRSLNYQSSYITNMPRKPPPTQRDFKHTWFIREWMKQASVSQAKMGRDLGWPPAKTSDVVNRQQYTQSLIDELAPYLNAHPWELLMHPAEAMAIRNMRKAAAVIVAERPAQELEGDDQGTGTGG